MGSGFWLALGAAVTAVGLFVVIARSLRTGTFGGRIVPFSIACVACVGVAIAAIVVGVGPVGLALALFGIGFPAFFTSTHLVGHQPKNIDVKVGDRVRDFTAIDGHGDRFELSSLAGQRFLLKFYRGHW